MTAILGLSAYYHDSAAALLIDGEIVAAAQEERFTRRKHDARFPGRAVQYVLGQAGIGLGAVDHVAFYDKPFLKFERLMQTYVANAPRGFRSFCMAIPVWIREKLFQKDLLTRELRRIDPAFRGRDTLLFAEHHFSHAASAFYPSPFEEAVVLTLDGVGEWATTTVAVGRGSELKICASCTSRIRWGCSTPPSPTTPASRSTAASTSSWGSPPTASRASRS